MFKFIKAENEEFNITEEYVRNIENKLNIKFPKSLREFYIEHNGAEIKECKFLLHNMEFLVCSICNLKYGSLPVEKILEYDSKNEYIPNECYPIAEDDINIYYWNTKDDKVYYYMHDDIEHPIEICKSVKNFFEILNSCSEGTVEIKNSDENRPNPYASLTDNARIENKENINPEEVLKYKNKFIKFSILILLILIAICILLIKISDSLSLILACMLGIWAIIFGIIDIINRIKTKKALSKYDINEIKKELLGKNVKKLKGIEIYLTKNYIISNSKYLKITRYDEIDWIYLSKAGGTVSQQAIINTAYKYGGKPLVAYLKNGKFVNVALVKNTEHINVIFSEVNQKNKNALIGNSEENIKKYTNINKKYNNKLNLDKIIAYSIIILIIIALIYNLFN